MVADVDLRVDFHAGLVEGSAAGSAGDSEDWILALKTRGAIAIIREIVEVIPQCLPWYC